MNIRKEPFLQEEERALAALPKTDPRGKQVRDVQRVLQHAKGYIELDQHGTIVHARLIEDAPMPIIAVVGVCERGRRGVILEIGLNRATPYASIKKIRKDDRGHVVRDGYKTRTRVRMITENEFRAIFPSLSDFLSTLVTHQRSKWEYRDVWFRGPGVSPSHRGIGIRVLREDIVPYRWVLCEDIRLRMRFLRRAAKYLRSLAGRMRYVIGNTKKEILRSNAGTTIVDIMGKGSDVPLHVHVAFRDLIEIDKQKTSRMRSLWENVSEEFGIKGYTEAEIEDMRKFLAPGRREDALKLSQLHLRVERIDENAIRKSMHGRGCVTGELIPTVQLVETHEAALVLREAVEEARLEREAIQSENDLPQDMRDNDNDIPF